jgi:uncharacterized alpha-E superfamily protein
MLSRTADHCFWMARYVERAENTARLLGVNVLAALLPQSLDEAERGWRATLGICELQPAFDSRYALLTPADVLDFMVRDPTNPSSIVSCLRAARENARAVRGTLTTELWETLNDTWLELERQLRSKQPERDPQKFFEWVKFRSHQARGVSIGTMLKDEAYNFVRLGTFLERADNTARLLDVKFQRTPEQPQAPALGGSASPADHEGLNGADLAHDFYHWAAVLRSVSAFEVYRKVYRDVITPARVAELLVLRDDMPRSLLACVNEVCGNLEQVRNDRSREAERRAGLLRAELRYGRIEDILAQGLHLWLTGFLERINDLGARISADFLVPPALQ